MFIKFLRRKCEELIGITTKVSSFNFDRDFIEAIPKATQTYKQNEKLDMVRYTCNLSSWELKASF